MSERIRIEEPGYVARYRESQRRAPDAAPADDDAPSFLRNYRRSSAEQRRASGPDAVNASIRRLGSAPSGRVATPRLAADVHLVRHGEAVGDAHDADLTDQGVWQARTYGLVLAAQCRDGEQVVLRHGGTLRTRRTAEHIRDGLVEGLAGRDVTVHEPAAAAAFANMRFVGPDGTCDVTEAFRSLYPAVSADGTPPLWYTELDRFWKLQLAGGDPIQLWIETPMLHFEPAALVARRFWGGIDAVAREHPGARLVVAAHSGCIRALAIAALGYDPGDLYNLEDVRAKLFADRRDALVSHRHKYQEICLPDMAALPVWNTVETWQPPITPQEAAS